MTQDDLVYVELVIRVHVLKLVDFHIVVMDSLMPLLEKNVMMVIEYLEIDVPIRVR